MCGARSQFPGPSFQSHVVTSCDIRETHWWMVITGPVHVNHQNIWGNNSQIVKLMSSPGQIYTSLDQELMSLQCSFQVSSFLKQKRRLPTTNWLGCQIQKKLHDKKVLYFTGKDCATIKTLGMGEALLWKRKGLALVAWFPVLRLVTNDNGRNFSLRYRVRGLEKYEYSSCLTHVAGIWL